MDTPPDSSSESEVSSTNSRRFTKNFSLMQKKNKQFTETAARNIRLPRKNTIDIARKFPKLDQGYQALPPKLGHVDASGTYEFNQESESSIKLP